MKRSDQPLPQPTPAPPGIWFPANEDITCPECNGPVLGAHQCTPKAI